MDNYVWVKIGVACVLILIALGLIVHRSREQKRSELRIKQLRENADGYHKDLAEQEERLLRETQQRQAEGRNPAEGKTRGLGNAQSGYTGSLASKLERNVPSPPPIISCEDKSGLIQRRIPTRDGRTLQRGHIPSSSSVRDVHHHEQDNTIPYLVAAAIILSDNDICPKESYNPPASDYNDRSSSCNSSSPSESSPTDSGSYD